MIYVTVDLSADREDWHLNVLERITRGIKGLEKEGFKVERYTSFDVEPQPNAKWILHITRAGDGGEDSY